MCDQKAIHFIGNLRPRLGFSWSKLDFFLDFFKPRCSCKIFLTKRKESIIKISLKCSFSHLVHDNKRSPDDRMWKYWLSSNTGLSVKVLMTNGVTIVWKDGFHPVAANLGFESMVVDKNFWMKIFEAQINLLTISWKYSMDKLLDEDLWSSDQFTANQLKALPRYD